MGVFWSILVACFGVWASLGKAWYWYAFNPLALLAGSSLFNSAWLASTTRSYAAVVVNGTKGVGIALVQFLTDAPFYLATYGLSYLVFRSHKLVLVFLAICIVLSMIVAFTDNRFGLAISSERALALAKRRAQDQQPASNPTSPGDTESDV